MPTECYSEMWWEDMSEKAHQAAIKLGYSAATWDDDASIPYDNKKFPETSIEERCAAMFLGLDPIEKKLDIWWEDTDSETQKYAKDIGWTQEKWDDDWMIRDLPVEEKYWDNLDEKERNAAIYFGYIKCTWDETDNVDDVDFNTSAKPNSAKPNKAKIDNDEKKEDDIGQLTSKIETVQVATTSTAGAAASEGHKIKAILKSKKFGGDGGEAFNHGNHKVITKITIRADEHAIHQISVVYMGGKLISSGLEKGDKVEQISLSDKEYITEIKVRHNKLIQSLTLFTNNGRKLGPVGGKGWPKIQMRQDHEGTEETVTAPNGHKLCGFSGGAGHFIDSIVFHWIPIN